MLLRPHLSLEMFRRLFLPLEQKQVRFAMDSTIALLSSQRIWKGRRLISESRPANLPDVLGREATQMPDQRF